MPTKKDFKIETSLIQTIGRAARNAEGKVTMYADKLTGSIERALSETNRKQKQINYNIKNNITPSTIKKMLMTFCLGFMKATLTWPV